MLSRISLVPLPPPSLPSRPTCYAPKNMLYKLFKLFTQVHYKEQAREQLLSLSLRSAAILVFFFFRLCVPPPSSLLICCFPLHNLWRLIMFRQTTNGTRKLAARDDFCWVPLPLPLTTHPPSHLLPPPTFPACLPLTPCDVCATRQSLFLFSVFPSRIAPYIIFLFIGGGAGDWGAG